MRAAILGLGWGRAHVGTFRAAGVEVYAIAGLDPERSRAVADAEGVPRSDLAAADECDIVVIATPRATHRALIERYAHRHWVLSEKPLFGVAPDPALEALACSPRLFVSYAFGFLASARAFFDAADVLDGALRVHVGLPGLSDPREALLEVAVHPLAAVTHRFGAFTLNGHRLDERALRGELTFARGGALALEVRTDAAPGIAIDLRGRTASLDARYTPSSAWCYRCEREGTTIAREGPEGNVWYEAHVAMVRAFVDRIEGRVRPEDAARQGLLTGSDAIGIEHGLAPLLSASN